VIVGNFDSRITFRFISFWDVAVALSKYVSESDPLPFIAAFARGYGQRDQRLTEAELDALPDLVTLRILSNVVYFTGRALAGEDGIESLTSRAAAYARRVRWLQSHADDFRATLRQVMHNPPAAAQ
jgi:Ser/Thr protein kinase RdoA (MazF antagonist)